MSTIGNSRSNSPRSASAIDQRSQRGKGGEEPRLRKRVAALMAITCIVSLTSVNRSDALPFLKKKNDIDASAQAEKNAAIDPETKKEMDKAARQLKDKDYKSALITYKSLFVSRPFDPNILLGIAFAAERCGDLDQAMKYGREATVCAPNQPETHIALAGYLEENHDSKAAYLQYVRVLELNPSKAVLDRIFGPTLRLLVEMKDMDEAEKQSRKWAKQFPGDSVCQYNNGWVLAQRGADKIPDAVSSYEAVLKLDPKLVGVRYNLALLFLRQRMNAEAAEQLNKFLQNAEADDPDRTHAKELLDKLTGKAPLSNQGAAAPSADTTEKKSSASAAPSQPNNEAGTAPPAVNSPSSSEPTPASSAAPSSSTPSNTPDSSAAPSSSTPAKTPDSSPAPSSSTPSNTPDSSAAPSSSTPSNTPDSSAAPSSSTPAKTPDSSAAPASSTLSMTPDSGAAPASSTQSKTPDSSAAPESSSQSKTPDSSIAQASSALASPPKSSQYSSSALDTSGSADSACTCDANVPGDGADLIGTKAPEFVGLQWFGPPLTLAKLHGKVVLVRFWFANCSMCRDSAPALNALYKRYADKGLVVIGIHHPKSPEGRDAKVVEEAAKANGFMFPIAIDNEWQTVNALWLRGRKHPYTSASILIDQNGIIRWVHPGGVLPLAAASSAVQSTTGHNQASGVNSPDTIVESPTFTSLDHEVRLLLASRSADKK